MQLCAGVILAGGKSSRMGLPKATLPFGPETMLERVLRIVRERLAPVCIVAAEGQRLPALPADVLIARDERPARGPLEGLLAGLSAVRDAGAARAFVTSCDVPLLTPAFVERMADLAEGHEIAVPVVDGFRHPLAAVYGVELIERIITLLAADQLRTSTLFGLARTRFVTREELADVDPDMRALDNLNRPADYLAALEEAGFTCPADVLAQLQANEAKESE